METRFASVRFRGDFLKQCRLEKGLSASQLAKTMNVCVETIYRHESEKGDPFASVVFGYSLLFDKPFEQFFTYKRSDESELTPEAGSLKVYLELIGISVLDDVLTGLSPEQLAEAKRWAGSEFQRGGRAQNPPAFLGNVHVRD